jgi:hypothetical protein
VQELPFTEKLSIFPLLFEATSHPTYLLSTEETQISKKKLFKWIGRDSKESIPRIFMNET